MLSIIINKNFNRFLILAIVEPESLKPHFSLISFRMDPGTGSHLLDDVHVLLDQLFMPPANADLGGTDDQGGIG